MFDIIFAIFLFMATVAVHILFCRHTKKPGLHAKAFIFTAMVSLGVYAAGVLAVEHAGVFEPFSLGGLPFKFTGGIIFILLVPIYLCFYVLTQLMSPSKKILLTVVQRGEASCADIVASIEEENFIRTRLDDLILSGCVRQVNGRYALTAEGQKIAAILDLMQSLLGRKAGG